MGHRLVVDMAGVDVESVREVRIAAERIAPAEIRKCLDERESRVGQGKRAGAGDGTRHVGYTVMNDVVDDIRRFGVRRRVTRFETSALVDRNIDHDCARMHVLDVLG